MATMLARQLTASEQMMKPYVELLFADSQRVRGRVSETVGSDAMGPFLVVMSMIDLPPRSGKQRALCGYLLATGGFLSYVSKPDTLTDDGLVAACRALQSINPRFDAVTEPDRPQA